MNTRNKVIFLCMLLVIVGLIEHINECDHEHIREDFKKKTLWILSLKN